MSRSASILEVSKKGATESRFACPSRASDEYGVAHSVAGRKEREVDHLTFFANTQFQHSHMSVMSFVYIFEVFQLLNSILFST